MAYRAGWGQNISASRNNLVIWRFFILKQNSKAERERLLDVAKLAVEIAIEQDEQAALAFIAARDE